MGRNHLNEISDETDNFLNESESSITEIKEFESENIRYHIEDIIEFAKSFAPQNSEGKAYAEKLVEDYIGDLDENTAANPEMSISTQESEYTDEELEEIWKNDPGYVNENVIYTYGKVKETEEGNKVTQPEYGELFENGKLKEEYHEYSEFYQKTGMHRVSWNPDAEKDSPSKTVSLESGTVLDRWHMPDLEDKGTYLTQAGADYSDLHLNVSQDKRELTQYEVIKPFKVLESMIGNQPFDTKKSEEYTQTKQFRTNMSIADLVDSGFLRPVDKKNKEEE